MGPAVNARVVRMLRWASAILLALGLVLAGFAVTLPMGPGVPALPDWSTAYAVLPAALLVGVVGAGWRMRSVRDRPRDRRFRIWCALLAASVGWPTWWAWRLSVIDVAGGLPVLAPFLLAIGGTAALVGAAVLTWLGLAPGERLDDQPPAHRRWRAPVLGAAAGVLVVGAAVAVATVVVPTAPVDATTASAVRAAAAPSSPTARAWDWQVPAGHQVGEVVSAGAGVVVLVADGVIALDGATGKERWHHRRTGALAGGLGASPDGGIVLVTFQSSAEDAEGTRVVALDAMTGEEIGFDEVTEGGVFGDVRLDLTKHILLGGNRDDGVFHGFDLRTGERRWEYRKPDECGWGRSADRPVVGRDVVLFGLVCGPTEPPGREVTVAVTLFALDDRTGAELWRHERAVPALANEISDSDGDISWTQAGWNIDQFLEMADDGSTAT